MVKVAVGGRSESVHLPKGAWESLASLSEGEQPDEQRHAHDELLPLEVVRVCDVLAHVVVDGLGGGLDVEAHDVLELPGRGCERGKGRKSATQGWDEKVCSAAQCAGCVPPTTRVNRAKS